MPRTPDASSVTHYIKVNATSIAEPAKKSRTSVVPIKDGFLSAVAKASQVSTSISKAMSIIASANTKSKSKK